MKVMVLVKASPASEAGEMPGTELLTEMGRFNEALVKAGRVGAKSLIKILSGGEVSGARTVKAHAFSAAAKAKIEQAGGTCEVISRAT